MVFEIWNENGDLMKKSKILPVVVLTAALALGPISTGKAKTSPAFEKNKSPTEQPQKLSSKETKESVSKNLENGWEQAQRRFRSVLGDIRTPRISAKETSPASFEAIFASDSSFLIYPIKGGDVVFEALDANAVKIIYPKGLEITKKDAERIASFALLSIALESRERTGGGYLSHESVTFLYSRLGTGPQTRECGYFGILTGFAAFFTNPKDPFTFLAKYAKVSTDDFQSATESYLGKGAWDNVIRANFNGSTELNEICKFILKRPDSRKLMGDYLAFMRTNFGIDASTAVFELEGKKMTLAEIAE